MILALLRHVINKKYSYRFASPITVVAPPNLTAKSCHFWLFLSKARTNWMVLLFFQGRSSSMDDRTLIWVHVQQNPCRRTQKPAARRRNEGNPQDTGRITTQKRPMTSTYVLSTHITYSTMQSSSARTGPSTHTSIHTHADAHKNTRRQKVMPDNSQRQG